MTVAAAYVLICVGFAIAGGYLGKAKGSSFWLWFLIAGILPVAGLLAAIFYRFETDELRRSCPRCGRIAKVYDAVCMRCGAEFEYPEVLIAPQSWRREPAPGPPAAGNGSEIH